MRIEGGFQHHAEHARGPSARRSHPSKSESAVKAPKETSQKSADAPARPERGVVRLIANDHFSGVADLRLRIRFQEQISAAGVAPMEPSELDTTATRGRAYSRLVEEYTALFSEPVEEAPTVEELVAEDGVDSAGASSEEDAGESLQPKVASE